MQILNFLLYILLALTSFFLICLVLIQRGKGGGLAGAFGGSGGSSAFGTKAGDVFTRVTMISAGVWIALNMLLVVLSNRRVSAYGNPDAPASKATFEPSKAADGKSGKSTPGLDLGPGLPASPKAGTPAIPPAEVSGGSPSAPVPPVPVAPANPTPTPAPAPAPTPKP